MKLPKPPHYIHATTPDSRQFITIINPACLCEVFEFADNPAATEFETNFQAACEKQNKPAFVAFICYNARYYVIAAIKVFKPITAADQEAADRIAAKFRRVAFWYLEEVLKKQ